MLRQTCKNALIIRINFPEYKYLEFTGLFEEKTTMKNVVLPQSYYKKHMLIWFF